MPAASTAVRGSGGQQARRRATWNRPGGSQAEDAAALGSLREQRQPCRRDRIKQPTQVLPSLQIAGQKKGPGSQGRSAPDRHGERDSPDSGAINDAKRAKQAPLQLSETLVRAAAAVTPDHPDPSPNRSGSRVSTVLFGKDAPLCNLTVATQIDRPKPDLSALSSVAIRQSHASRASPTT